MVCILFCLALIDYELLQSVNQFRSILIVKWIRLDMEMTETQKKHLNLLADAFV